MTVSHIACDVQRKGLEAQIASLTDGYGQEIERLQNQINALTAAHQQGIDRLQRPPLNCDAKPQQLATQQVTTDDLNQRHAIEIARVNAEHEEQVKTLQIQADTLRAEHEQETARLQAEIDTTKQATVNQTAAHQHEIDTLKQHHAEATARLQKQYEDKSAADRSAIDAAYKSQREKIEAQHSTTLLQRNDQIFALRSAAETQKQRAETSEATVKGLQVDLQKSQSEHEATKASIPKQSAEQLAAVERQVQATFAKRLQDAKRKAEDYEEGTLHMMKSLADQKKARLDLETEMNEELRKVRADKDETVTKMQRERYNLVHSFERRVREEAKDALLIKMSSVAFKTEPAYAVRKGDTLRIIAQKLTRDIKNLDVSDMDFGVRCQTHYGALRRISAYDFDQTFEDLGVRDGDHIGYARNGNSLPGRSGPLCAHQHKTK